MSEEDPLRNKWKGWDCETNGCWKKQAVAETKAKRNRPPKLKVENTPPSPNRVRRGKPSPRTVIEVWQRDKGRCYHCDKKLTANTVTFDHVIPVCRGGRSSSRNMVLSCARCNSRRGNEPLVRKGKTGHHVECEPMEKEAAVPREIIASVRTGSRKSGPGTGRRTHSQR